MRWFYHRVRWRASAILVWEATRSIDLNCEVVPLHCEVPKFWNPCLGYQLDYELVPFQSEMPGFYDLYGRGQGAIDHN